MKKLFLTALVLFSGSYPGFCEEIKQVPFNEVSVEGGFWGTRLETEIKTTIPFSVKHGEPAVERFRRCAAYLAGEETELPEPHRFISSDLYKVMEGVAYSLIIHPDKELEEHMDMIIDLIGKSQKEDGYLYISHICKNPYPGEMGDRPYSWIVHSHELYNMGHLYEAAVAYYQATGKRNFLDVAIKSAKHINKVIFEGGDPNYNDGKAIMQAPGHQEIELALCKLYLATNDPLYLQMAKKFLEIRGVTYCPTGEGVMSPTYAQQHLPVRDQRTAVGHAVRAAYQYIGMAQVDKLMGRNDYDEALDAIWNNLVSTRMHITGGLGAVEGFEGFGDEYDLPNLTAYNETCAAVANVFFNHAMFLKSGNSKYLDIAELSLFNNALAGINLAGDRFFYVNPLEADGKRLFNHGIAGRAEWFGCACCPPNISRLILQAPGYMFAHTSDKIYFTLYSDCKTSVGIKGSEVNITERSGYPFDGNVSLKFTINKPTEFEARLRIPQWAVSQDFVPGGLYKFIDKNKTRVTIKVNGKRVKYKLENGFAVIKREWRNNDTIEMVIPMPVRKVASDSRIVYNNNKTAFTRGPLVYCAEEIDNNCKTQELNLSGVSSKINTTTIHSGVLKGIPEIVVGNDAKSIKLIPYYAWCNRGDNMSMSIWIDDRPQTR